MQYDFWENTLILITNNIRKVYQKHTYTTTKKKLGVIIKRGVLEIKKKKKLTDRYLEVQKKKNKNISN